jgi:GNAT superfamily N-acetyltransferase
MDLSYRSVNLAEDLERCLAFRRDAWQVSFGSMNGYCDDDTQSWFEHLAEEYPNQFLHVFSQQNCIGQLEFRFGLTSKDGRAMGYINLFYLTPDMRGSGAGQAMHDEVMCRLRQAGCEIAMLRVIPGNGRAERFYHKNGWSARGEVDAKRGQLMIKKLIEL